MQSTRVTITRLCQDRREAQLEVVIRLYRSEDVVVARSGGLTLAVFAISAALAVSLPVPVSFSVTVALTIVLSVTILHFAVTIVRASRAVTVATVIITLAAIILARRIVASATAGRDATTTG